MRGDFTLSLLIAAALLAPARGYAGPPEESRPQGEQVQQQTVQQTQDRYAPPPVSRPPRREVSATQRPVRQEPPSETPVQPPPAATALPDGNDVLRGLHIWRVTRIALTRDRSYDTDGALIVLVRFDIDLAARTAEAPAPALRPLRLVTWSTDSDVGGVFLDSQAATVTETATGARASGTATIRIETSGARGWLGGTPHYNLKIVDPDSEVESTPAVIVEGSAAGWPSWLVGLALALGLGLFSWIAIRRAERAGRLEAAVAADAKVDATAAPRAAAPPPAYPESGEVPAVPAALVAAIAAGRGFLSIGTGAAGQAGLPTGTELMRMLVNRFEKKLPEGFADVASDGRAIGHASFVTSPLGKGMDVLLSSVHREQVVELIAAALREPPRARDFHEIAVSPPWRGIASLAWDDLAYQAIRASGNDNWQRLRPDDQTLFTETLRKPEPIYLDVLGELQFPASLSLSMDELRRNLSRNPEWQRGLTLLMQTHCFLFIGTEPDVLEQFFQTLYLETGGPGEPRHFALAPIGADIDLWTHSLARFGVALLPYGPAAGHRAVGAFMNDLRSLAAARGEQPSAPPVRPTPQIGAISLRNIGPFESLKLKLATEPQADGARPWTVIFGSNGMGKSTILRAATLALIGVDPRTAGAGAKLLKSGAKEGSIELHLGAESLRTRLYRDGSNVIVDSPQVTPVQAGFCLVLGFPSLRGAPTPNPTGLSTPEKAVAPEAADLLPLLHGTVDDRLGNFKQWLLNILVMAGQGDARAISQRDLLDRIIRDIVPGDIDGLLPVGSDFTLMVNTADGPVPFDGMSQGMSSIFNWLGVLVQRLYQFYIESPNPELEEATVIVDEIDAHLHPDWQRRLVGLTKQNFPRIQVIATSHSPLLAGALHAGEVCVLEREHADAPIAPLAQVPDLFGLHSHDILTSAAFGLQTDRNPQAEAQMREYFTLYEKSDPTEAEQTRMAALKAELDSLRYGEPTCPLGKLSCPLWESTLPPPPLQSAQVDPASAEEAEQLRTTLAALKMGPSEAPEGETS